MTTFNSLRRDFLRISAPDLAAAAIPAFSSNSASAQDASTSSTGYLRRPQLRRHRRRQDPRHRRRQSRHRSSRRSRWRSRRLPRRKLPLLLHSPQEPRSPATCCKAAPSSPPTRRSPANRPAITAESTTPPSPRPHGTPTRTTATTTGTTPCSGAKTSTTSASPGPA